MESSDLTTGIVPGLHVPARERRRPSAYPKSAQPHVYVAPPADDLAGPVLAVPSVWTEGAASDDGVTLCVLEGEGTRCSGCEARAVVRATYADLATRLESGLLVPPDAPHAWTLDSEPGDVTTYRPVALTTPAQDRAWAAVDLAPLVDERDPLRVDDAGALHPAEDPERLAPRVVVKTRHPRIAAARRYNATRGWHPPVDHAVAAQLEARQLERDRVDALLQDHAVLRRARRERLRLAGADVADALMRRQAAEHSQERIAVGKAARAAGAAVRRRGVEANAVEALGAGLTRAWRGWLGSYVWRRLRFLRAPRPLGWSLFWAPRDPPPHRMEAPGVVSSNKGQVSPGAGRNTPSALSDCGFVQPTRCPTGRWVVWTCSAGHLEHAWSGCTRLDCERCRDNVSRQRAQRGWESTGRLAEEWGWCVLTVPPVARAAVARLGPKAFKAAAWRATSSWYRERGWRTGGQVWLHPVGSLRVCPMCQDAPPVRDDGPETPPCACGRRRVEADGQTWHPHANVGVPLVGVGRHGVERIPHWVATRQLRRLAQLWALHLAEALATVDACAAAALAGDVSVVKGRGLAAAVGGHVVVNYGYKQGAAAIRHGLRYNARSFPGWSAWTGTRGGVGWGLLSNRKVMRWNAAVFSAGLRLARLPSPHVCVRCGSDVVLSGTTSITSWCPTGPPPEWMSATLHAVWEGRRAGERDVQW